MLITVVLNDTPSTRLESMDAVMNRLTGVLLTTLRKSDLVCRWSQSQFLLLLFDLKKENTELIFNRIKTQFAKITPDSSAVFLMSINSI